MRTLVIAAAVAVTTAAGCKKDPLREDMEMFCRAVDVIHELEDGPRGIYTGELSTAVLDPVLRLVLVVSHAVLLRRRSRRC